MTGLAFRFLMPVAAASSIAPDREQRRISELILAGLTPGQILVAKGMAAVLPFLAVAAVALIAQYVTYQLAVITDPERFNAGFSAGLMLLSGSGVATAGLLVSAAIQVCISALSRRTASAVVICYGFQCLLVPLLSLVSLFVWALVGMGWLGISTYLAPQPAVLLLEAITFCVLWPPALRALAYQD